MDADVPLVEIVLRSLLFLVSFLARCFFAGSETAFLSADAWAIEGLSSTGDNRARLLSSLSKDRRSTISALLIGTNVCTVLCSVMGASIASLLGASEMISIAVVPLTITGLLFLFSELVPKTYSAGMPTETALAIAPTLSALVAVLRPISHVLSAAPHLLAGMLAERKVTAPQGSDESVRVAVDMAAEEGQVDKEDGEVIVGVLDSSDTRVKDIMVPMAEVTALSPQTTVCDALSAFRLHRFSRVPVVSPDNGVVAGVVYMKDVVREAMKTPACQTPVSGLMRRPFTVSPADNLLDVLARMRKSRVHFAVVVEGTQPAGIATMEDILTEIVGEVAEDERPKQARKASVLQTVRVDDGMVEGDQLDRDGGLA
jgi:CBS domain containing-hemolysin-like protein